MFSLVESWVDIGHHEDFKNAKLDFEIYPSEKFFKYLAFIPARGDSKRLPGKNIINFMGKPLIAWTIEAALKSNFIGDEVVVSTDNRKIANISKTYGATIPYLRPTQLSRDHISIVDVLIDYLGNLSEHPDYVVVLQPTSPLRTAFYIDDAIKKWGEMTRP